MRWRRWIIIDSFFFIFSLFPCSSFLLLGVCQRKANSSSGVWNVSILSAAATLLLLCGFIEICPRASKSEKSEEDWRGHLGCCSSKKQRCAHTKHIGDSFSFSRFNNFVSSFSPSTRWWSRGGESKRIGRVRWFWPYQRQLIRLGVRARALFYPLPLDALVKT